MRIEILAYPFDPWDELRRHQTQIDARRGIFGACASFVGTLRDSNEGDGVHAMRLEHYPGMTDKYLHNIVTEAMHRWSILDLIILHRVGARLGVARADTAVANAQLITARARPNPTLTGTYSAAVPNYHLIADIPIDFPANSFF